MFHLIQIDYYRKIAISRFYLNITEYSTCRFNMQVIWTEDKYRQNDT